MNLLEIAGYKEYKKINTQWMRSYIEGEDLIAQGISVSPEDTPEIGGMIAINIDKPEDRWYIAKQFFTDNYEEVLGN